MDDKKIRCLVDATAIFNGYFTSSNWPARISHPTGLSF